MKRQPIVEPVPSADISAQRPSSRISDDATPSKEPWDAVHDTIISYRDEASQISASVELPIPSRVLDLACGTGNHLAEFAKQGHTCVGVDRDLKKLSLASSRLTSDGLRAGLVCADIRALPLQSTYDLVLCLYGLSTLHSEGEIARVLQDVRSLLRPGGNFVFNVLHREANTDPVSPLYALVRLGHLRDYATSDVFSLLRQNDLHPRWVRYLDIAGVRDLDMQVTATTRSR